MNCDTYKINGQQNAFLFVEQGIKPENVISDKYLDLVGKLEFFKSIKFDETSPSIAVNPQEVITNIKTNGFHIQHSEIKIKEVSKAGATIGGGILAASLGFGAIGAIVGASIGYALANALNKENEK